MHHDVPCNTIYNDQDMEATKMSTDRGMDKEDMIHVHNGMLAVKRGKSRHLQQHGWA